MRGLREHKGVAFELPGDRPPASCVMAANRLPVTSAAITRTAAQMTVRAPAIPTNWIRTRVHGINPGHTYSFIGGTMNIYRYGQSAVSEAHPNCLERPPN